LRNSIWSIIFIKLFGSMIYPSIGLIAWIKVDLLSHTIIIRLVLFFEFFYRICIWNIAWANSNIGDVQLFVFQNNGTIWKYPVIFLLTISVHWCGLILITKVNVFSNLCSFVGRHQFAKERLDSWPLSWSVGQHLFSVFSLSYRVDIIIKVR
jgi:hypothetical protein